MIIQDLEARLKNPRNSARGTTRNRTSRTDVKRTVEDLDRNDHKAGPNLFIRDSTQGKRPGDTHLPPELQVPASILAKLGVPSTEIQETFGISDGTVQDLKRGNSLNDEAKEVVNTALESIRSKVIDRLDQSVNYLTEDKLAKANGKDLTTMMRALAGVVKDTAPAHESQGQSRVQVVVHSVNRKDDDHYEVIEVNT